MGRRACLIDDWDRNEEATQGKQIRSYAECHIDQSIVHIW